MVSRFSISEGGLILSLFINTYCAEIEVAVEGLTSPGPNAMRSAPSKTGLRLSLLNRHLDQDPIPNSSLVLRRCRPRKTPAKNYLACRNRARLFPPRRHIDADCGKIFVFSGKCDLCEEPCVYYSGRSVLFPSSPRQYQKYHPLQVR
jgi:hypothetical protein